MPPPQRTCLGCGLKGDKAGFLRLAVAHDVLVADSKAILPGRGAYCCRTPGCYQRLMKQKKKLAWAMRWHKTDATRPLTVSPELAGHFF